MTDKVYGRIVDGEVVEYPVYEIHIKNRAHPKSWYTEVVKLKTPAVNPIFEYIREELSIAGGVIIATPKVVKNTLDEVLNNLAYPNGRNIPIGGEDDGRVEVTFANLDPSIVSRVVDMVSKQADDMLDAFVQTKFYSSVASAATYLGSANLQFKAEAERVVYLRDQTYGALYTYLGEVTAGTRAVPISFSEIETNLPTLTWE